MKKILTVGLVFCAVAAAAASNKMSMVTYFPVPYVAYSRVNVSEQLDAGLTGSCNMNLGCNESAVNLSVNTLNVKQSSKLDLNGGKGVLSNRMTLGNGNDNGRIAFSKVRIQGGTSRSINVKDTLNVPSLKLFESDFPDCKQAGGKDGTMSWTPLKLKGASGSELYLACGEKGTGTQEEEKPDPPVVKKRCLTALNQCAWTKVDCGWDADRCESLPSGSNWPAECTQPRWMLDTRSRLGPAIQAALTQYRDIPAGCDVNGECNSCEVGHRYVYNHGGPVSDGHGYKMWVFGQGCKEGLQYKTVLQIQYATCVEVSGDTCPVTNHKDCRGEKMTLVDTGFVPSEPGGLEVELP